MHAATLLQPLKTTLRVGPLYYDRGQQVAHSAGLWDAESIIFNRGRSVADFPRVGYFIPLNGPLNGHPPSSLLLPLANFNSEEVLKSRFARVVGSDRLHQTRWAGYSRASTQGLSGTHLYIIWIWIILDDVYADFCRGAGSV